MSLDQLRAMSRGVAPSQPNAAQQIEIVAPTRNAMPVLPPTEVNDINLANFNIVGEDILQLEVLNRGGTDKVLIIGGGIYGTEGYAGIIGIANSAADVDTVTDQGGANVLKTQAFNHVVNGHSYIAKRVQVFAASDSAQREVAPQKFRLTPNGDLKKLKTEYVESNVDLNYVEIAGVVPFSFFQGLLYTIKAGESVKIEAEMLGVGAAENFVPSIGG